MSGAVYVGYLWSICGVFVEYLWSICGVFMWSPAVWRRMTNSGEGGFQFQDCLCFMGLLAGAAATDIRIILLGEHFDKTSGEPEEIWDDMTWE